MKTKIAAGASLCSLIGFFITDCASGNRGMEETIVNDRRHVPSRDWYTVHTDADGDVQIQHHHAPEEWRVMFSNGDDLNVGSGIYHAVEVGQRCFIAYRVGRWTKAQYLKNVRLDLDPKGPIER